MFWWGFLAGVVTFVTLEASVILCALAANREQTQNRQGATRPYNPDPWGPCG